MTKFIGSEIMSKKEIKKEYGFNANKKEWEILNDIEGMRVNLTLLWKQAKEKK